LEGLAGLRKVAAMISGALDIQPWLDYNAADKHGSTVCRPPSVRPATVPHMSIAPGTWEDEGTANGALFCPGWDTILRRWDTKLDTILHRWDTILSRWDTEGHQQTPKWRPTRLWSSMGPVEGSRGGFLGPSGRKIRSGWPKRTRSHFAIFAGCGILLPTSFQPSKGGDMVCARGPLGACVATYGKVYKNEGPLRV
jgi:hypothetical protein